VHKFKLIIVCGIHLSIQFLYVNRYLFEQIKNGPKHDHGICFVSSSATLPSDRKAKSKQIDDVSRVVADRLSKRNANDIILVPFNPEFDFHYIICS